MNILQKLKECIQRFFTGNVHYVNGSDTLPPPLTKQEEQEVFCRLMDDDTEARKTLIVHNLRSISQKSSNPQA